MDVFDWESSFLQYANLSDLSDQTDVKGNILEYHN